MGLFDIALLLEPLAGDLPTGEDLEYDQKFIDLELKAQGTPDRVDLVEDSENPGRTVERIVPGKECEPRAVLDTALSFFQRTKDLRVAMYVAYCATRIEGLIGLSNGTELVARMLEQYWDEVYPLLDPGDPPDPFMRINVLNGFCDPAMLLRALKGAPLVEAKAIGRFTMRDLDVASGDASPLEGQTAATPELLRATCAEMDQDLLAERLAACNAILANLKAIEAIFRERVSATPDLGPLVKVIERAASIYGSNSLSGEADEAADENADAHFGGGNESASRPVSGKIASRADAKRLLEQVCGYLEQAEPAHPSPILVRRAIRLLDMSFMEIVRELTPESITEIERLGGIRNE